MKLSLALLLAFTACSYGVTSIFVNNTIATADTTNYHYVSQNLSAAGFVQFKAGSVDTAGGSVSSFVNSVSGQVRIGFFSGYNSATAMVLRDETTTLSTVLGMFTPVGETGADKFGDNTTSTLLIRSTGRITTNILNVTMVAGSGANSGTPTTGLTFGTRMFALVIDSATSRTGDASDGLLEKWSLVSGDDWIVPSSEQPLTLGFKTVDTAAEVFHGRLGSITSTNSIPEPTSFTLAGLAALGLVSRRRRA
jgi:hypothetical protein